MFPRLYHNAVTVKERVCDNECLSRSDCIRLGQEIRSGKRAQRYCME